LGKFGLSKARGRRAVPRTAAPLVVTLSSSVEKWSATIVDVSRTGAKLRSASLPAEGAEITFSAGKVRAACEVIWSDADQCAVAFDIPIASAEVGRLRSLANFINVVGS